MLTVGAAPNTSAQCDFQSHTGALVLADLPLWWNLCQRWHFLDLQQENGEALL